MQARRAVASNLSVHGEIETPHLEGWKGADRKIKGPNASSNAYEHSLLPRLDPPVVSDSIDSTVITIECDSVVTKNFNKLVAADDALARYLDFRCGDVVRLDKYSSITGTSISYRVVVHSQSVV